MSLRQAKSTTAEVAVVIPNWNGANGLHRSVESVLEQTYADLLLIIVDNGSTDNSKEVIQQYASKDLRIHTIWNTSNLGYTGGMNPGLQYALDQGCEYVAALNDDAQADKRWLEHLLEFLKENPTYGIATSKMLHEDGKTIDDTGDIYTSWGLPYPRGRDEKTSKRYDTDTEIFSASGGATVYRCSMLKEIGLFDDDFFAYYEDVDLSFRAQLTGWKVAYVPNAVVYHEQGGTSKRMIGGFTTYQTMKNLPLVLYKNVPRKFLISMGIRLTIARTLFLLRAITRKQGLMALKGDVAATKLIIRKRAERKRIQAMKTVSDDYIWSIIVHDLPPNATALRKIRKPFMRVFGKI